MPWKECQKMDEKLRFVSRHLEGESISSLCREFGISRVTGCVFHHQRDRDFILNVTDL
jgi:lysophospholipid acyltransferase (LPLAT)-like uncharacterized protein